jgi:hypothetical protein
MLNLGLALDEGSKWWIHGAAIGVREAYEALAIAEALVPVAPPAITHGAAPPVHLEVLGTELPHVWQFGGSE